MRLWVNNYSNLYRFQRACPRDDVPKKIFFFLNRYQNAHWAPKASSPFATRVPFNLAISYGFCATMAFHGHAATWRTTSYRYEPYLSLHLTFFIRSGLTISNTGAEATQKRFWKEVGIEKRGDSLTVTLDKRALKTPGGQTLLLPLNKTLPAALIAAEWDNQEVLLKPHALPMVNM